MTRFLMVRSSRLSQTAGADQGAAPGQRFRDFRNPRTSAAKKKRSILLGGLAMRPESAVQTDHAEEEPPRRTGRRVLLALGVLLIVLVGAVPILVLLSGPEKRLGHRIGFGATGPTVSVRSGIIGPIDVQRTPGLADAGVEVKYVGTSSFARGNLLGYTETRGFTVRITPGKEAIEPEDLTFILIDDQDKVIGEGTLKLPSKIDVGESGDGKVDIVLKGEDGAPAKLIIGRKGE
jgi:hypothetical protein